MIGELTSAATPNAQARLKRNRTSGDSAILFNSLGKISLPKTITQPNKTTIFIPTTRKSSKLKFAGAFTPPILERIIRIKIATKS